MKTFGIKNSKCKSEFKKFFKKYHNKEIGLRRFEKIFCYKAIYDENEIDNFNDGKDKVRHKIIFDFVKRIIGGTENSYDSNELVDIIIDNDQYNKAIKDIAKNSIYFKNEEKNRALFFKTKGKYKPINDKNQMYYIKTIQSLLSLYCINLGIHKRIRKNKELMYTYLLSVDKQIKNIVEYKHNEINTVNKFKNLFD